MNFREYAERKELLEIFDKDDISRYQPTGKWTNKDLYQFNIPSSQEQCSGGYCYYVRFEDDDDNLGSIDISFGHADTGVKDRYQVEQGDTKEVMYSVLKATDEYINKWKPEAISWIGVSKSRPNATNLDARSKVYFSWAAKNLFPNYLPMENDHWVRRDVAEEIHDEILDFHPLRHEIDQLRGIKDAKRFLQGVDQARGNWRVQMRSQRMTPQDLNQGQGQEYANNPRYNPNRLQIGDMIYTEWGLLLKITGWAFQHNALYATTQSTSGGTMAPLVPIERDWPRKASSDEIHRANSNAGYLPDRMPF